MMQQFLLTGACSQQSSKNVAAMCTDDSQCDGTPKSCQLLRDYADIVAHHMYVYADCLEASAAGYAPACVPNVIERVQLIAQAAGLGDAPTWSTEGNNIGWDKAITDFDTAEAATARYLLQTMGRNDTAITWF